MTDTMPMWFLLASLGLFGAVLGSFLNVCIYRVPRNQSVVSPPSSCPGCGHRIAAYDNVPVLGWLWLRGRCRSCRTRISLRYPSVELLTAVIFVLLTLKYGWSWELLPALYFAATMVVITLIDFDARIIPDVITFTGVPLGLLSTLVTPVTLVDGLIGAVAGFAFLYLVAWGYQKSTGVDGLGGGDIKFAAMLGAFLGWQGVLLTVFAASFVGSVAGGILMAMQKGGRRTALPFGTFLAPVGLAVYLWGGTLIAWYLGHFPR